MERPVANRLAVRGTGNISANVAEGELGDTRHPHDCHRSDCCGLLPHFGGSLKRALPQREFAQTAFCLPQCLPQRDFLASFRNQKIEKVIAPSARIRFHAAFVFANGGKADIA